MELSSYVGWAESVGAFSNVCDPREFPSSSSIQAPIRAILALPEFA